LPERAEKKTMKTDTVFGILLEFETETYQVHVRYFVFSLRIWCGWEMELGCLPGVSLYYV